jgi:hypothetical protein
MEGPQARHWLGTLGRGGGTPVNERFVPIRPGIEEHLVRGDMSLCEFGVYALIHIQADYRTGIWRGSAPRILATAPRGASLRQVQRALEHFENMGYLKSFRVHGARGNAPYLIDKFTVRSGALKGYRVIVAKSESWQRPFYELVTEVVAEHDAVPVADGVAEHDALSRSKKKEVTEKKETRAKPAPASDVRFGPFLGFAKNSFEVKHKRPPTWDCFGKDGSDLAAFLRRAPQVTLEIWQTHVLNFFASTEEFTAKQGGSLAYFVRRFDTFSSGPILEKQSVGGTNGSTKKLTGDALTTANLRAAGFVQ